MSKNIGSNYYYVVISPSLYPISGLKSTPPDLRNHQLKWHADNILFQRQIGRFAQKTNFFAVLIKGG